MDSRLIVALDVPDAGRALALADRLQGLCGWFKVGLELYIAEGNAIVHELRKRDFSVFLDLKFHDIPNTVAGAIRSAAGAGAQMLTVHAAGGPAMLEAAAEAADSVPNPPQLLAVTVLTSMDQLQLSAIGIDHSPETQVLRLADTAAEAGINGFVASPEEVSALRHRFSEATLVIPGIRPAGAAAGDQKRIATPSAALAAGASCLVIGRPITQAADPVAAARAILDEMAQVPASFHPRSAPAESRPTEPCTIRRATPDDAAAILACLHEAFAPYRDAYTAAAFADTVLSPESLAARFATMTLLVAAAPDGAIVGTIAASIDGEEGHLRGMAVKPAVQGRGIAQQLLHAAESLLRARGCRRVTLDTTAPLAQATRFYRHNGYKLTGRVQDFYGMPLHEFAKNLSGV